MIETKGLGAGSYPSPPEPIEKTYQFDFDASTRGYGVVTASNIEEARKLIETNDYDDIVETYGLNIEEITDIKEI